MKRLVVVAVLFAFVAAGCSSEPESSQGSAASPIELTGTVEIEFWHGQPDEGGKILDQLVADFNSSQSTIHVTSSTGGVTADDMLPKVTSALAAGTYPDVVYLFGSWAANIGKSDKVVDLSARVASDTSIGWDDFWPAGQAAISPGGKVIGFPALIDNLSVVYNKQLFDEAGLAYPSADWTWEDFRATAKALTDPSKNVYGVNWPVSGSLDTVWRFIPMLWQRGGQILSEDGTQAVFNSPEGVDILETLRQMSVEDGSIYLDPNDSKAEPLFTSGHLGMFITGPWEVPVFQDANMDWGDQVLPGVDGDHQTVAGPDNWVILDHSPERVEASVQFLKWLTAPEQEIRWMMATGSLPVRKSIMDLPEYQDFLAAYPGIQAMADNLANAKQAMPAKTQWPRIVDSLGQAIASVLLGEAEPADALSKAADEANALLAVPD